MKWEGGTPRGPGPEAQKRGESTRKWTASPVTRLLDLELRPEPTRYGGKAKFVGRRRVSGLWPGPTLPCQGQSTTDLGLKSSSASRHHGVLGK